MAQKRTSRVSRSGAERSQAQNSAESIAPNDGPTPPPSAETILLVAEAVFAMMNAQPRVEVPPVVAPVQATVVEPVVVEPVPVEPVVARRGADKQIKYVLSFHPPTFTGEEAPTQVEDWLSRIKRTLTATQTEERQKVTIATFLLDGEARLWWDEIEMHHLAGRNLYEVTMEEFSKLFMDRFLPSAQRIALENEFQRLTQGESSFDDYLHEFTRLGRYSNFTFADEQRKTNRFYEGLRDDLRLLLSGPMTQGFQVLVNTGRALDQDMKRVQSKKNLAVKKPEFKPSTSSKSEHRNRWKKSRSSGPSPSFSGASTGRGPLTCYTCGKVGHIARECRSGPPRTEKKTGVPYAEKGKAGESSGSQYAPAQPRVYNLGQQEAIKQTDVVTGAAGPSGK